MAEKAYQMKPTGREPEPKMEPLERMMLIARRMLGIQGFVHRTESRREAAFKTFVAPEDVRIARASQFIEECRDTLFALLQEQPEGQRSLRVGGKTYSIQRGRYSVEVDDDESAIKELEALGPKGAACLKPKTGFTIKKKEVKLLLESTDGPELECIRMKKGRDTLKG